MPTERIASSTRRATSSFSGSLRSRSEPHFEAGRAERSRRGRLPPRTRSGARSPGRILHRVRAATAFAGFLGAQQAADLGFEAARNPDDGQRPAQAALELLVAPFARHQPVLVRPAHDRHGALDADGHLEAMGKERS